MGFEAIETVLRCISILGCQCISGAKIYLSIFINIPAFRLVFVDLRGPCLLILYILKSLHRWNLQQHLSRHTQQPKRHLQYAGFYCSRGIAGCFQNVLRGPWTVSSGHFHLQLIIARTVMITVLSQKWCLRSAINQYHIHLIWPTAFDGVYLIFLRSQKILFIWWLLLNCVNLIYSFIQWISK